LGKLKGPDITDAGVDETDEWRWTFGHPNISNHLSGSAIEIPSCAASVNDHRDQNRDGDSGQYRLKESISYQAQIRESETDVKL